MTLLLKPPQPPARDDRTLSGLVRSKLTGKSGRIKRLVIELPSGCVEIRIPKSLRHLAQLELEIGEPVRIWLEAGTQRMTALALVPLNPRTVLPHACNVARTCILVCNSKSCCRRGGNELYSKLVEATQTHPTLEVKKCRCLKQCGRGPNVKVAGQGVEAMSLQEIPRLVQKLRPKSAWN